MLYFIAIGFLLYGLFIKSGKKYSAVIVAFLVFAFFCCSDLPDTYAYELSYYNGSTKAEPGYMLLVGIGRSLGLSYDAFAAALMLASLVIAAAVIGKCSSNPAFTWSLLLIYPLFISMTQSRFLLASSIAVAAMLLLQRPSPKKIALFVALIALSASIHYLAAVYLLALLSTVKGRSRNVALRVVVVLMFVVALLIPDIVRSVLMQIEGREMYATVSVSLVAALAYIAFQFVTYALVTAACRYTADDPALAGFSEFVRTLMLIFLSLSPLVLVALDFYRIQRALLLLAFVVSSNAIYPSQGTTRVRLRLYVPAVLLALAGFYIFIVIPGSYEEIYEALLTFEGMPAFFS